MLAPAIAADEARARSAFAGPTATSAASASTTPPAPTAAATSAANTGCYPAVTATVSSADRAQASRPTSTATAAEAKANTTAEGSAPAARCATTSPPSCSPPTAQQQPKPPASSTCSPTWIGPRASTPGNATRRSTSYYAGSARARFHSHTTDSTKRQQASRANTSANCSSTTDYSPAAIPTSPGSSDGCRNASTPSTIRLFDVRSSSSRDGTTSDESDNGLAKSCVERCTRRSRRSPRSAGS